MVCSKKAKGDSVSREQKAAVPPAGSASTQPTGAFRLLRPTCSTFLKRQAESFQFPVQEFHSHLASILTLQVSKTWTQAVKDNDVLDSLRDGGLKKVPKGCLPKGRLGSL